MDKLLVVFSDQGVGPRLRAKGFLWISASVSGDANDTSLALQSR